MTVGEPEFLCRFASFGNPSFPNSRAASGLLHAKTDARIETNPRLLPLAPERSEGCSPKNWTGNREFLFRLAKPILGAGDITISQAVRDFEGLLRQGETL